MALSDAQLQTIANSLFLLKKPKPGKLAKPANTTGANSLTAALDPIGNDPQYKDIGIGVIDFTADADNPRIWIHNGETAWRIGSTSKIAILLAALQLRDDVRQVMALNILPTDPAEYDKLFQMQALWNKSKDSRIRQIAGADRAPRISTIFDFANYNLAEEKGIKPQPIDFLGPDPDTQNLSSNFDLVKNLSNNDLTWAAATDLPFSTRLSLCGVLSDNVAASSCISEIGVDYLKAIQRAYGLYDDDQSRGMHLLLSGMFVPSIPANAHLTSDPHSPVYRQLQRPEPIKVKDYIRDTPTSDYTDNMSWIGGSVCALAAYMIALISNKLINDDPESQRGIQGCTTIRKNLSPGINGISTFSNIVRGIQNVTGVTSQFSKIGLLRKGDGEKTPLQSEFAYVETTTSADASRALKFAVVAIGITDPATRKPLGEAICRALLTA